MWHLPREIFDSAIGSLNKVRGLKKHSKWLQRRKHLIEINIKDTLKSHIWKLNVHF